MSDWQIILNAGHWAEVFDLAACGKPAIQIARELDMDIAAVRRRLAALRRHELLEPVGRQGREFVHRAGPRSALLEAAVKAARDGSIYGTHPDFGGFVVTRIEDAPPGSTMYPKAHDGHSMLLQIFGP